MLYVDYVVADTEIAEVGDEGRGLRFFRKRARGYIDFVGEIVGAEDDEIGFGEHDAGSDWRAHDDGHAEIAGHEAGFFKHHVAARLWNAAAKTVGDLVIAQDSGEALDVALMHSSKHDAGFRLHQLFQLLGERGNGAVEAKGGPSGQLDLTQRRVFLEHVNRAELIEVQAHVRAERRLQDFGAQINVFRADERTNSGALVTQLDFIPPAVNLIADHAWLIDKERASGQKREQRTLGTGDRRKELPAWEDTDAAGCCSFRGHLFILDFDALAA